MSLKAQNHQINTPVKPVLASQSTFGGKSFYQNILETSPGNLRLIDLIWQWDTVDLAPPPSTFQPQK